MADVRQALEESEDSIGSLESKLESLKVKKRNDSRVDYDSSPTESALPCPKSEGFKFYSKDTCKDGLSAGSFTQEAQTNWALDCQIPAAVPTEDTDSKPVGDALTYEREKFSSIDKLADALCGGKLPCMRKRRGKRKRKDCSKDTKEGSVRESEALCPADVASALLCKENSVSNSAQIAKSSAVEDQSGGSTREGIDDIMRIFSSVAENDCASVFRQRLDSQNTREYKSALHLRRNTSNDRNPVDGACHGKTSAADSPASDESLAVTKKVSASRPRKVSSGRTSQKPEARTKGRKRSESR
ncbi:hypothetical protein PVK06_020703 [Gossypium arboreum]|uniref:Uncharacterized protein n=1 Tax=Gossypium arboreum TaxID=29729 RepID=A0ABR0PNJ7_GOSAR|nr:hypothetical protein PVK06_020703 [Gossypium arboreum]